MGCGRSSAEVLLRDLNMFACCCLNFQWAWTFLNPSELLSNLFTSSLIWHFILVELVVYFAYQICKLLENISESPGFFYAPTFQFSQWFLYLCDSLLQSQPFFLFLSTSSVPCFSVFGCCHHLPENNYSEKERSILAQGFGGFSPWSVAPCFYAHVKAETSLQKDMAEENTSPHGSQEEGKRRRAREQGAKDHVVHLFPSLSSDAIKLWFHWWANPLDGGGALLILSLPQEPSAATKLLSHEVWGHFNPKHSVLLVSVPLFLFFKQQWFSVPSIVIAFP